MERKDNDGSESLLDLKLMGLGNRLELGCKGTIIIKI